MTAKKEKERGRGKRREREARKGGMVERERNKEIKLPIKPHCCDLFSLSSPHLMFLPLLIGSLCYEPINTLIYG